MRYIGCLAMAVFTVLVLVSCGGIDDGCGHITGVVSYMPHGDSVWRDTKAVIRVTIEGCEYMPDTYVTRGDHGRFDMPLRYTGDLPVDVTIHAEVVSDGVTYASDTVITSNTRSFTCHLYVKDVVSVKPRNTR